MKEGQASCFDCGTTGGELQSHHVVPRALGGTATVDLCGSCHAKVHAVTGLAGHAGISHQALTRKALADKKRRGERIGMVPFGFVADGMGKLSPEMTEQAAIRAVLALRSKGLSFRKIVRTLDSEGIKSRNGRPLAFGQVWRIVRNAQPKE